MITDLVPGAAFDGHIMGAAIERQVANLLQKSAYQIMIESHVPSAFAAVKGQAR